MNSYMARLFDGLLDGSIDGGLVDGRLNGCIGVSRRAEGSMNAWVVGKMNKWMAK